MEYKDFIKAAANVRPSKKQMRILTEIEFYAFIHFGPNTFSNAEWGEGAEDPTIFNPTELDCDQWTAAIKSAGMRGVVLTAKHHDGFCLWQSKYTEHCMKNSPYKDGKGDVVRELSEACARAGLEFGVYLSPWDRNSKLYGTDEYNTYYKNQLTELLTGYGKLFHLWFDGACGEGPNGKKQVYDYDGYIELIHKYQPDATIFNDGGPDVRWCGNEAGHARRAEWAVVPKELCHRAEVQTHGALLEGSLSHMTNGDEDIGTLKNIQYSEGLVFCPSEVDMSIRPGWFYHEKEEPHSLDRLFNTYITSVGGNATFILNIPPNRKGLFDDRDVARLKELGDKIRESFAEDYVKQEGASVTRETISETQCVYTVKLPAEECFEFVVLEEDIAQGQRISSFRVSTPDMNGGWSVRFEGETVGHRKICPVNLYSDEVKITVTSARDEVLMKKIALY